MQETKALEPNIKQVIPREPKCAQEPKTWEPTLRRSLK